MLFQGIFMNDSDVHGNVICKLHKESWNILFVQLIKKSTLVWTSEK